jgi:hypothetical protein
MLKDPFYAPCEDFPEESIETELFALCAPPKPPPPSRPQVTAPLFLPGGAKKAWDAGAKWPGRGRITSPAAMKTAAANSLKAATEGPLVNAICVDKSTGHAFYRHADGRMSPRAL